MPHPTIRILAFSPARVNAAGDCLLPVTSSPHAAALGGSLALMRSLAESILAVTGSSQQRPAATVRKPGSGRYPRLSPAAEARYERIAARVAAGEATWKQAALDEGVKPSAAYNWNFLRRAQARLPGGPARTNAGPVATGNGTHQEPVA